MSDMSQSGRSPCAPIRILHITYPLVRGGVETWLLHVFERVDLNRYRMDVATHRLGCDLEDAYRSLGVRVFQIARADHPLAHWRSLRRLLKEHGPYDIVNSFVHHSGIDIRICRDLVPVRITHARTSAPAFRDGSILHRLVLRLTHPWIRRYSTHGLACSEQAAIAFFGADWKSDGRWQVLHAGIDLRRLRGSMPNSEQLRRAFCLPPAGPIVGHVGRLAAVKNHKFLLEVARQVIRTRPDVHFVFAGDGPLRKDIERLVTDYGLGAHVHLLGSVSNVPELMRSLFDLLLFPSLYEGLPLVVIESQAAGLRAIVSEAVPAEAVVVPGLVERLPLAAGAKAWAQRVLSALAEPRKISPDESLAMVSATDFNIDCCVDRLIRLYDRAVSDTRSGASLA